MGISGGLFFEVDSPNLKNSFSKPSFKKIGLEVPILRASLERRNALVVVEIL